MPPPIISVPSLTNPLTLYRSLLATKQIEPDPSQYRLAVHLQKLYFRLLDYSPQVDYGTRLKALSRTVDRPPKSTEDRQIAVPGHPLRRNPLFAHLFTKKEERGTLALTRVLTSHEEVMNLKSPRGLLIHGEVGSGKSMLVDLLADGLPNRKKRRWHFNTFMLETLAKLEQLRQSRSTEPDPEYSLLWLAKDLIEKSPILFLDEFQLPDRAASKILSNLLTAFFQLGGVLIATSNRMPDELSKASGIDFATPSRGGLMKSLYDFNAKQRMSGLSSDNEYGTFVEVLKARCEIWNIDGSRDYRRREAEETDDKLWKSANKPTEDLAEGIAVPKSLLENESGVDSIKEEGKVATTTPSFYLLDIPSNERFWQSAVRSAVSSNSDPIPWQSTTLQVYGRKIPVLHHLKGVTCWSFSSLCGGTFGPADYITLASTFHTLILDHVPVLTLLQKNEARRLITLLDALYEARCKLILRAEVVPDDLFFPETKVNLGGGSPKLENDQKDAVYPETISEIYQDQTSPFRPNVSSYTAESRSGYDPDEDSDFGPVPGKGNEIGREIDFGMTSSFTGEDERFAYKRAASRLWEMCSSRWHARSEPGWWRPLPVEVRRWERSSLPNPTASEPRSNNESDVKLGGSIELDRPAGLQGKLMEENEMISSSFKEKREPPPKIGWTHAWGMMKWGKRAGLWGEGPEGLEKRKAKKKE